MPYAPKLPRPRREMEHESALGGLSYPPKTGNTGNTGNNPAPLAASGSADQPPVPPGPGPCPDCGGPLRPFAESGSTSGTYRRGLACQKCGRETERPPETAPLGFVAEPATGRPVYWEDARGAIREGRAVLLGRDGATFWVGVDHAGGFSWVRDDRLRSRAAFEAQRPLRAVEPIRERRAP
jgi:hypothetical protein